MPRTLGTQRQSGEHRDFRHIQETGTFYSLSCPIVLDVQDCLAQFLKNVFIPSAQQSSTCVKRPSLITFIAWVPFSTAKQICFYWLSTCRCPLLHCHQVVRSCNLVFRMMNVSLSPFPLQGTLVFHERNIAETFFLFA